jgi:hypothetical protein
MRGEFKGQAQRQCGRVSLEVLRVYVRPNLPNGVSPVYQIPIDFDFPRFQEMEWPRTTPEI